MIVCTFGISITFFQKSILLRTKMSNIKDKNKSLKAFTLSLDRLNLIINF